VSERTLEELLAVVARSLGARSARVADADEQLPADAVFVECELPDGRRLVADLASAPADTTAIQRRLEMLAEMFSDLLPTARRRRPSRPPPVRTLREELAALVARAGASDAIVIDAHSPVIWGSAAEPSAPTADGGIPRATAAPEVRPASVTALHPVGPEDVAAVQYGLASAQGVRIDPGAVGVVPRAVCAKHRILPIARDKDRLVVAMADPLDADAIHDVVLTTGLDVEPVFAGESMTAFFRHLDESSDTRTYDEAIAAIGAEVRAVREPRALRAKAAWARTVRARRAIAEVRTLPDMPKLRRGGHLRELVSEPGFGYLARSFGGIYVLIVVFEGPFEELLAKRAVTQVLPTIERLVAALPPLEPQPIGGVAALRRRKRRS
jgi:hypothetical protein